MHAEAGRRMCIGDYICKNHLLTFTLQMDLRAIVLSLVCGTFLYTEVCPSETIQNLRIVKSTNAHPQMVVF